MFFCFAVINNTIYREIFFMKDVSHNKKKRERERERERDSLRHDLSVLSEFIYSVSWADYSFLLFKNNRCVYTCTLRRHKCERVVVRVCVCVCVGNVYSGSLIAALCRSMQYFFAESITIAHAKSRTL